MSEVDDAIAAARASWSRISEPAAGPTASRRARLAEQRTGQKRAAMLLSAAVGVVAVLVTGAVAGLTAALIATALVAAMLMLMGRIPDDPVATAVPPPDRLRTVDIKALPAQTERWLRTQRPALPAPAQHLVDRIGERLDVLSPQLARVEADGEAAHDIRRLVGEQLPAFLGDYARVPEPLRRTERNGRTPDAALVDGLALIEREIAAMTERLAQGDLDSLQTRSRFLEMKYRDERPD